MKMNEYKIVQDLKDCTENDSSAIDERLRDGGHIVGGQPDRETGRFVAQVVARRWREHAERNGSMAAYSNDNA